MKKILLVLAIVLFGMTGTVSAQSLEETVYLKNGSIVRGVIIEQIPNESVKLQTRDGNIFVYRMEEIQKIAKEQTENSYRPYTQTDNSYRPYTQTNNSYYQRSSAVRRSASNIESGYFGSVNFGYEIGVGEGIDRIKFDVVNGYRILPEFSIGLGVGVKYYTDAELVTIPLYAHLRTDLLRQNVTPFIAFNVGYNISTDDFWKGGVLLEPSVGVGIRMNRKSQLNISLGYSLNYFKIELIEVAETGWGYMNYSETCKIRDGALMIHIGYMW